MINILGITWEQNRDIENRTSLAFFNLKLRVGEEKAKKIKERLIQESKQQLKPNIEYVIEGMNYY